MRAWPWFLVACGLLLLAAAPKSATAGSRASFAALAQPAGQIPNEEQEERKMIERDYMSRSAEKFGKGSIAYFNRMMARFNLNPAKLMIAFGALGVILTWGKNKRKPHWAVLFTLCLLLLLGGLAAMHYHWHPLV